MAKYGFFLNKNLEGRVGEPGSQAQELGERSCSQRQHHHWSQGGCKGRNYAQTSLTSLFEKDLCVMCLKGKVAIFSQGLCNWD